MRDDVKAGNVRFTTKGEQLVDVDVRLGYTLRSVSGAEMEVSHAQGARATTWRNIVASWPVAASGWTAVTTEAQGGRRPGPRKRVPAAALGVRLPGVAARLAALVAPPHQRELADHERHHRRDQQPEPERQREVPEQVLERRVRRVLEDEERAAAPAGCRRR